MSVQRPFVDCRYACFPHSGGYRVVGSGVPEIFEFDTPERAIRACYVLHDVYGEGMKAAKTEIRKAIGL